MVLHVKTAPTKIQTFTTFPIISEVFPKIITEDFQKLSKLFKNLPEHFLTPSEFPRISEFPNVAENFLKLPKLFQSIFDKYQIFQVNDIPG